MSLETMCIDESNLLENFSSVPTLCGINYLHIYNSILETLKSNFIVKLRLVIKKFNLELFLLQLMDHEVL